MKLLPRKPFLMNTQKTKWVKNERENKGHDQKLTKSSNGSKILTQKTVFENSVKVVNTEVVLILYKLFESGFDVIFSGLSSSLLRGNIGKGKICTGGDESNAGDDAGECEFELLRGRRKGPKYHF